MTKKALTPSGILRLLDDQFEWTRSNNCEAPLLYADFKKNLMCINEVTTDKRKVKEIWNDLSEFEFFKKTNGTAAIVDVNLVKKKLGVESVPDKGD
ncbi:MAG: hypothetical protein M0Q19_10535 [Candidatus Cloacimonetes bacterium]|nr:hypothetical protein [Candidatus Cloacimonadota bacterium]